MPNTKESANILTEEEAGQLCESILCKLEYLGLGTNHYTIHEDSGPGYKYECLPRALCHMIDDIESQLKTLNNYFVNQSIIKAREDTPF